MTRHPDAGVLAEFREGLLGRRCSARVRAHLAACPHCASVDAGLAEVTDLLAGAPAPRMPGHLIARLDSALTAEAARRQPAMGAGASTADAGDGASGPVPAGAATPQPDGQPGSSLPGGHAGRRGRRPGWRPARSGGAGHRRPAVLGAAAAVMIVLAGAGYGLASLAQQQGGTASAAGSAAGGSRPPSRSGVSRGPAASPQSSRAVNSPAARPAYRGSQTSLPVIDSGMDYQPSTLASQAEDALASHRAASGPTERTATRAMRVCVKQVTGGRAPELVDVARYQGRPATIIVLGASGGQPGKVFVTGAACSEHRPDVLDQATLPSSG